MPDTDDLKAVVSANKGRLQSMRKLIIGILIVVGASIALAIGSALITGISVIVTNLGNGG